MYISRCDGVANTRQPIMAAGIAVDPWIAADNQSRLIELTQVLGICFQREKYVL